MQEGLERHFGKKGPDTRGSLCVEGFWSNDPWWCNVYWRNWAGYIIWELIRNCGFCGGGKNSILKRSDTIFAKYSEIYIQSSIFLMLNFIRYPTTYADKNNTTTNVYVINLSTLIYYMQKWCMPTDDKQNNYQRDGNYVVRKVYKWIFRNLLNI